MFRCNLLSIKDIKLRPATKFLAHPLASPRAPPLSVPSSNVTHLGKIRNGTKGKIGCLFPLMLPTVDNTCLDTPPSVTELGAMALGRFIIRHYSHSHPTNPLTVLPPVPLRLNPSSPRRRARKATLATNITNNLPPRQLIPSKLKPHTLAQRRPRVKSLPYP